jgi:hypothetical protein
MAEHRLFLMLRKWSIKDLVSDLFHPKRNKMSLEDSIYAQPRVIKDIKDCYFYHTIDLPGYGTMKGDWDLRGGVDAYLGFVPLKGMRVLEIGTANGYVCFEMEKRGADVTGYDLSENDSWDIVPYGGIVTEDQLQNRRKILKGINNAWWMAHELLKSKARVAYGTVYNIPQDIGPVDVATFGSILLHLRDPFLALQKVACLTKETIIVTDWPRNFVNIIRFPFIPNVIRKKIANQFLFAPLFLPDPDKNGPWDAWWSLTPELISRYLKILGFTKIRVSYSKQKFASFPKPVKLFTVVGTREKH